MVKRVVLFPTCLVELFFPSVITATHRILNKLGIEVFLSQRGICCGQPAFNDGFFGEAKEVAINLINSMDHGELIVFPSGSCVSMIKHNYLELFKEEPLYKEKVRDLGERIYELTDFLVNILEVVDLGSRFDARVTYHDACHTKRVLGIYKEPRILLENVKGLEIVEMIDSDKCCGFGGVFSVKFNDLSVEILDDKIRRIEKTGCDYVVSTDISCLMHMGGRLRRKKSGIKFLHIAEILANF
jgi:L-lactate dehydrogenase complex protein LldE